MGFAERPAATNAENVPAIAAHELIMDGIVRMKKPTAAKAARRSMYIEPKDSRQRYTKQCLFDSLLHALEQKPVSDITVSEICEEAGISRKTFYKYYSDQFALLLAMQDDLFAGFERYVEKLPHNVFDMVPALMAFASEHRVLVRAAFENRGQGNFIDRVIAYLYDAYHSDWERANPNLPKQDVTFLFHFVASGLVGIIRLWLFEEPELSAEEVAKKADFLLRMASPKSDA